MRACLRFHLHRMKALSFRIILATGLLGGFSPARAELADAVLVIVNDSIITYQDMVLSVGPTAELLRMQYGNRPELLREKLDKVQQDGIEQLVERKLILHDFETSGYVIPESLLDKMVEERIKERYPDRIKFTKTLQAEGSTLEDFRKEVREQFIIDVLTQKNVSQSLIISPHKIEEYYLQNQENYRVEEQVKLRMIVVKRGDSGTNDPARARMEEIIRKLDEGASFAQMASIYSDGSQRAQGGDWGWVDKFNADGSPVLRKELFGAAFSLEPGQRSGIIETPDSYYLMLAEDKRPSQIKPLSEVRESIEQELLFKERARLRKKWIDRLKEKSFIRSF